MAASARLPGRQDSQRRLTVRPAADGTLAADGGTVAAQGGAARSNRHAK
jgi:hypothetical protein